MASKAVTGPDRLLFDRIIAAFQADGQYIAQFDQGDIAGIATVRTLGRRAARELGWKVFTKVCEPNRQGQVDVWVVVTESSPLREQLQRTRSIKKWFASGGPPPAD